LTKGKKISVDKIADIIFSTEDMEITKFKQFLCKSLYAATAYIEYLESVVTKKNICKFRHTLTDVFIDYEWLIVNIELYYKDLVDNDDIVQLSTGSRRSLNTMDMLNSLMQIHYIETFDNITDIYLRDLKPLMIFQIRQLL
jgi:predicted thioredoxin/glutaredoxin